MKVNAEKLVKFSVYSAFVAVTIFLTGTTLAMIFFPNYNFLDQFLSELGIRANNNLPLDWDMIAAPYSEIFNVTVMLTAIFLLPFFPASYFILKPKGTLRKVLQIIVSISGVTAGFFLFFVGVFDFGLFPDSHVVAALGLYYCIIIICLLWGIAISTLNKDSPYKKNKIWIIDPLVSIAGILVGVINIGSFGLFEIFTNFLSMAFYQKILAYLFMVFFGYVSIRFVILLNKNEVKHENSSKEI
ncbi:MAG: DUF998 domain-containing protein [Candidatus Heimdallarchaeaceae archaeon]